MKFLQFQEYNHHKSHTEIHTFSFTHQSQTSNQEFIKRMDAIKKYLNLHLLIRNTRLSIVSLFLLEKLYSAFLIEIKTKISMFPNNNLQINKNHPFTNLSLSIHNMKINLYFDNKIAISNKSKIIPNLLKNIIIVR